MTRALHRLAVIGNPNTGKSTLFNALTGLKQRVGNYPGVTVEHTIGTLQVAGHVVELIDLPGTYSLAAQSPDEMLAVNVLTGKQPGTRPVDGVLVIVDATNLRRNLYLVTQLLELGRPMLLVLNMMDLARQRGLTVDVSALSQRLGVAVVETCARHGQGLEDVRGALATLATHAAPTPYIPLDGHGPRGGNGSAATLEATMRYQWIREVLRGVVTEPVQPKPTISDRLDAVLTHKWWGTLIFASVTAFVFQSIYTWSGPLMTLIDWIFGSVGRAVGQHLPVGALHSLVVDGVIGGVGSVLVFLPQIALLFFFLALLEDCGYMARAAFLMDKVLAKIGLSGKSFIPLLSSFACAVPGIMATRTIENRRDRMVTILVAPLMSCSARLPIYTILIAAFIPARTWLGGAIGLQGLTLFAMHLLGVVVAIPVVWILKRTLFRSATPAFVMELPSYKVPALRLVGHRVLERGKAFVRRAGTIIFAMTIIVWALAYFPRPAAIGEQFAAQRVRAESPAARNAVDRAEAGAYLRASAFGHLGHWLEPVVQPLGWDWRIGMAALASFPAREVIIAVLGTTYNLGDEVDETSTSLQTAMRAAVWPDGHKVFTVPVALSIMVFFALCCQCMATVATIRREANSWGLAAFAFGYMTILAYVGAWATYQLGTAVIG